jgi:hypothetical protein
MGTISGGASSTSVAAGNGITIAGAATVVQNYGSIQGGYSGTSGAGAGVDVSGTSAIITNHGEITGGYAAGNGVYVGAADVSVTNDGQIRAGQVLFDYTTRSGVGVVLASGGILTNSGTITGGDALNLSYTSSGPHGGIGVALLNNGGSVTNSGLIEGGNGGYGTPAGTGGTGLYAASAAKVTNTGTIYGGNGGGGYYQSGSGGAGVLLLHGGNNINSGTIVGGAAPSYSGGKRVHGGNGGTGVELPDGGTLINTGTIRGASGATELRGGTGGNGGNGVQLSNGTLVTSGTISGGTGGGSLLGHADGTAGYAVLLTGSSELVIDPGAVFNGKVLADSLVLSGTTAGTLSGLGTQFIDFGTLTESAGSTWILSGAESLSAGSTLRDAGFLTFSGTVSNIGTVTVDGGTLALVGRATNSGTIEVSHGAVSSTLGIAGDGVLEVGASGTLSLLNGALVGQVVDFLPGAARVDLAHPLSFYGTFSNFGAGDRIDLTKPAGLSETGFSFADGALKIVDGTSVVADLHFAGPYSTADFHLTSDQNGGILISFI